jgi:hypothetical protein
VKVSRTSALRAACVVLLTLAASAAAAQDGLGGAPSLTDLRVGVHPDHTRIVIETDARTPFVLDPGEREILVHVEAAATAEAVTARSPHLVLVKVEPTALGTDVRIQLKQPVEVRQLVLERPDRIVLDLYPKLKAPAPLPAPEVLPEAEPPPPVVAVAQPEPQPERPVEAAPAPEPGMAPEQEPGLPAEAEPPLLLELPEGEEPEVPSELEPPAGEPEAGLEPELEAGQMTLEPAPPSDEAGEQTLTETAGEPMTPNLPTVPAVPAPGSRFGSPFTLGAFALVLLALFVWLRRRARDGRRLPPPLPEEDREPYEPPSRAVPVGDEGEAGESVFDVEPDALDAHEPAPSLRTPVASGLDSEDESERRIAHLEKRVEELGEAKDRLERQIAAQTEELRVQRAAIARTQRVLRSIAPKGDDEPSEPVPRG